MTTHLHILELATLYMKNDIVPLKLNTLLVVGDAADILKYMNVHDCRPGEDYNVLPSHRSGVNRCAAA